jgi:hypothetical protein
MAMRWRKSGSTKRAFDAAVRADQQRGGDRQEPPAVALKLLEIDAELPVGLLDLVADPKHQPERNAYARSRSVSTLNGRPRLCCRDRA